MNEPATDRRWFWAALALTALKLWLTAAQPIFAIGPALHDDALFLQLGESIARGEWLGAYNQMTLAKGPFYPLWIALAHLIGVPLFLSQHLLYAGACAALVRACRPALTSAAARFGFYALLLWNPMTFDASSLGRVLRQHVYVALGLLLFAGLAALYFRRRETLRRQLPWAVLLGVSFAAFYLTREETIWIAPSLALLAGAVVLGAVRESLRTALRSAAALAVATGCALAPLLSVCALNLHHYGWFGTVEFRDPAFNDAYGALTRVRVGPDLPSVPVTRQAREALYAVSPTFAQLRPYLDGDLGRGWAAASSSVTGQPPEERQIGGGWLMWALRDAVAAAGRAHSAGEAHAFYSAMADELNAACDSGRVPAGPRRSGFLPVWREGQKPAVARTVAEFADFVVSFSRFSAHAPASEGGEDSLALFHRMTGGDLSPERTALLADARIGALHVIGKTLRHVLFWLFVTAQLVAIVRVVQVLRRRTWTFPLTLAAAAWGGGLVYVTIQAIIHVTSFPVMVISSFASAYPFVPLFIGAIAWDVFAARAPSQNAAPSTAAEPARAAPVERAAPAEADVPWRRRLPWFTGLLALAPFVLWHGEFAKLVWFADDLFLVDEISRIGLWRWLCVFFTESFVPLFKLGWGGALHLFGGSYLALLTLLWLTHALNVALLGRVLLRVGLPWFAAVAAQVVFALTPGNLESLAWSVQWSALLATTFLLLGLHVLGNDSARDVCPSWRTTALLALCAAASACCFARGVLTGGVFSVAVLAPAALDRDWRGLVRRTPAALCALAPAIAVALAILLIPQGNQRQLGGHLFEVAQFAATFLFLSPGPQLFGADVTFASALVFGATKIAVVAGSFSVARGRMRALLLALTAYDLGNAVLLGIGRYHTGALAALGQRYLYGSLLATLPFLAFLLAHFATRFVAHVRLRTALASALLLLLAVHFLRGWPAALAPFVAWRGTEMRALLAAPYNPAPDVKVPALDFMHLERAKALQRAYDLH
ncbi:MAG TPA: hypothetical protein VK178_15520 [Opitutaceae bacterium]|nr:hypothetical protein [Opitutaceae bacterium]